MFTNPDEAREYINTNHTDIVFLDIEMNGANGIEFAKELPKHIGVIFTTAYINYALDGFNLDAVDFLHKPFSFERFNEAVDKAVRRIKYNNILKNSKTIIVKEKYNNVPILIKDIFYIEAMENYSKIYLKNSTMVLAHNSLKNIAEQLPSPCFARIHKSYIIPLNEIKSFTRQNVTLSNGVTLPVGRQYSNVLFNK